MSDFFKPTDPFKDVRPSTCVENNLDDELMPMIISWRAVKRAAHDWQTFSSDAPFRVPIPSEERVRSVRQLPIEADPPLHTEIRAKLEPWFRRPKEKGYIEALDQLIAAEIKRVLAAEVELVRDFALPLQSRALTLLFNMTLEEADEWISWGTHVFRDGDDPAQKGNVLEAYIDRRLAYAYLHPQAHLQAKPRDDFFSALSKMTVEGRPLTKAEMAGVANLVFAGGRDTVINAVTTLIVMFAHDRTVFERAATDDRSVNLAIEELLRVISPLAHIGRICAAGATVGDCPVEEGRRVSVAWAGANFDPEVFDDPDQMILDRAPNPHMAFGSGPHACLGASQARAILRLLLKRLCADTQLVEILSAVSAEEQLGGFIHVNGFERVNARLS
ncbi:MAG: cytochrome P450 [Pseudomonadota bacterium]